MYPSRPLQLLLQQSIHHPVPCGLHFRLERFGRDEHTEMGLFGYTALHGLVVRVHARIVVNFQCDGLQGRRYLHVDLVSAGSEVGRTVVGVP